MDEFKIKPEKTAIKTGVSNGTKYICNTFSKNNNKILDYGAGKLRNSKYLSELNFDVSVLDTQEQVKGWDLDFVKKKFSNIYTTNSDINEKFDIILCSFVLNVIEDESVRQNILNKISDLLVKNGVAIIEVRGERFVKTAKTIKSYKDGYILGSGQIKTFQKPYNRETFYNLLSSEKKFFIKDIITNSDSLTAIIYKII